MNIITNRPIRMVNFDSGDDFYSMEGDYSNGDAKGTKKSKPAKATKDRTPKDKTQKNINKAIRKSNREKDKVSRRLNKSKAKVKPNAKPLTETVSKDGKGKVFVENVKALFKKKTKTPSGEVGETKKPNSETASSGSQSDSKTPNSTPTPTTTETFYKKDEKGNDVPVSNNDVTMKNGQPFDKKDIEQAIGDGAELLNTASGLVAQYTPNDVVAVDDEVADKTEYYKKSDIEGNWWAKQSTTVKVAIVGGSLALVGFLGYMIFKSKK